jgi:hypothetical protein
MSNSVEETDTLPDQFGWITAQHFRASQAFQALRAAKRTRVAEYDERLRLLEHFRATLLIKAMDGQQELFNRDEILSPRITKLMDAPLQGLD